MGCRESNNRGTGKKMALYSITIILMLCLAVFSVLSFYFEETMMSPVKGSGYVPAPPTGPHLGFVNLEYQYEITTMNANASWMFDWGDGNTTPWLHLGSATTSIVQNHDWTAKGNYTVRIKFKNTMYPTGIWSDPLLVSISIPMITDYPSVPILMSGTIEGVNRTVYMYAIRGTDPHNYRVQYRCDFGDGTLSNWTLLVSSGSHSLITHCWNKPGNFSMRFQSLSESGLYSSWSMSVPVIIHNTSENDQTFMDLIVLNGVTDYMTYQLDHSGTFYNDTTERSSRIHWDGQGTYFLDDNSDGKWDYKYTPAAGLLEPVPPQVVVKKQQGSSSIPWLWIFIIIGIIVGVTATIVVLIKAGYLYLYEEVVEK